MRKPPGDAGRNNKRALQEYFFERTNCDQKTTNISNERMGRNMQFRNISGTRETLKLINTTPPCELTKTLADVLIRTRQSLSNIQK